MRTGDKILKRHSQKRTPNHVSRDCYSQIVALRQPSEVIAGAKCTHTRDLCVRNKTAGFSVNGVVHSTQTHTHAHAHAHTNTRTQTKTRQLTSQADLGVGEQTDQRLSMIVLRVSLEIFLVTLSIGTFELIDTCRKSSVMTPIVHFVLESS